MKNVNLILKMKCIELGITEKILATEMELSETQFCRKVNHTKINSSIAQLTKCEKFYLSERLGVDIKDID